MNCRDAAVAVDASLQSAATDTDAVADLLRQVSVETSPSAADRVESFRQHLAAGTRVYIATLPDTAFERVIATARRLTDEGMVPVPHLPARGIAGPKQLDKVLGGLVDQAGVREVLTIGGGLREPVGTFDCTMQMLRTGLFQRRGIDRIAVAGHPEGSPDIDAAGLSEAIAEKNAFARDTGIAMHLVTQFCFDAAPVVAWDRAIRRQGNRLPVHVGVPGPATLRSLLSYARLCGIGNSAKLLRRQGANIAKLGMVSAPDRLIAGLARYRTENPNSGVAQVHFYTFGGLRRSALWLDAVRQGEIDWRPDRNGFVARVAL